MGNSGSNWWKEPEGLGCDSGAILQVAEPHTVSSIRSINRNGTPPVGFKRFGPSLEWAVPVLNGTPTVCSTWLRTHPSWEILVHVFPGVWGTTSSPLGVWLAGVTCPEQRQMGDFSHH